MSFPDAQVMQISMPNAIKAMEIMLVMAGLSLNQHGPCRCVESRVRFFQRILAFSAPALLYV